MFKEKREQGANADRNVNPNALEGAAFDKLINPLGCTAQYFAHGGVLRNVSRMVQGVWGLELMDWQVPTLTKRLLPAVSGSHALFPIEVFRCRVPKMRILSGICKETRMQANAQSTTRKPPWMST